LCHASWTMSVSKRSTDCLYLMMAVPNWVWTCIIGVQTIERCMYFHSIFCLQVNSIWILAVIIADIWDSKDFQKNPEAVYNLLVSVCVALKFIIHVQTFSKNNILFYSVKYWKIDNEKHNNISCINNVENLFEVNKVISGL
jgi:hypothetical protein